MKTDYRVEVRVKEKSFDSEWEVFMYRIPAESRLQAKRRACARFGAENAERLAYAYPLYFEVSIRSEVRRGRNKI